MKFLRQGICLAVLGAGLAVVPTLQATAGSDGLRPPDRSLVQKIKDQADGAVRVSTERATNKVGFLRVSRGGDLMPSRKGDSFATAQDKAAAFLDKYAAVLGAGEGQLRQSKVAKDKLGWTFSYTQKYRGVPVFGATIRAHIDKQGDLTAVNGFAVPGIDLSVNPRLSADAANERAVSVVKAGPATRRGESARRDTTGVKATANDLMIYRKGATRGIAGESVLVYVVEVGNGGNIRETVFVDAQTGKVVNRYSMVHDALFRRVYEENYDEASVVWEEGDPFPGTLTEDQQNIVTFSGDAYWLFRNAFGRDSYDGAGAEMETVNNDPRISCPNANWNGVTTNYCNGVTSDDTVAHEWAHAYTEYTHNLIYQWQPGALNESYSDIWGETVDFLNAEMNDPGEGEDERRPVGQCSKYTRGPIEATINSPAEVVGPCEAAAPASFGPVFDDAGVTADVVVATDPDEDGPDPVFTNLDGCSPFDNAGEVSGNWAYVDRGACTFQTKVDNAEAAGAEGIVVGNNRDEPPISMSATSDLYGLMVAQSDGGRFKTAGTANVTVRDAGTEPTADSFRWLSAENDPAFGGAIRDMWEPTCYGDPGKVSDAEYFCDTDDGGGVHSNSGVPNHGYALLVDGATYNGETIGGIGLDKAAAIYWRAQANYQTETTDFADHADALDASCADLIGQPINELTVTPDAPPTLAAPITEADCDQVAAMARAVELRKEPVQCNFQPLLAPGELSPCGKGFKGKKAFKENFGDGLAGWTVEDERATYTGDEQTAWVADSTLPGDRSGTAAYAPDPTGGSCDGGSDDLTGHTTLTSSDIVIPTGQKSPRLEFDHYVSTEFGYDGGNVKLSVNGGPFEFVPYFQYLHNDPFVIFSEAEGNTNPLAGEDGFTGTDGGEVTGSWGQSVIDLGGYGVRGGDTIKVQFDFGVDGCSGIDGWYVDNVAVTTCRVKAGMKAKQVPKPSTYGKHSHVEVTVNQGDGEAAPTGTVKLRKKNGDRVGKVETLEDGSASIRLPKKFPVGKRKLRVIYSGDDSFAKQKEKVKVRVRKADSDTLARVKDADRRLEPGENFQVRAKVSAPVKVRGKVVVKDGQDRLARERIRGKKEWLRVREDLAPGRHELTVIFKGSDTVRASRDTVVVRVLN